MSVPRYCVACNEEGHTVTTCTTRAAAIIRDLRLKLRLKREGQRRKPHRVSPKKYGTAKQRANKQYTPHPLPERRKLVRRVPAASLRGHGIVSGIGADDFTSLATLQAKKYVPMYNKCPVCKKGKVTGPFRAKKAVKKTLREKGGDALLYRCTKYNCNVRFNAFKHSYFRGTRLTPKQVALIVMRYTDLEKMVPPRVDDLASEAEAGTKSVRFVIEKLRAAEVGVAKKQNKRGHLSGDVEIDGHGVRSHHVSTKNPHFKELQTAALVKQKHPYYLNYIRVLGARQRGGGRMYLQLLPNKLLPPKAKPSPEGEAEVTNSGILKRINPRSTVVHSDGAKGIRSALLKQRPRMKHRSVSHKNMEFVKKVAPVRLPSGRLSSSLTGTQCIDSTWKTLDASIPKELRTKRNHKVNPRLADYVWSWLYRVNHRNTDGFAAMGSYIQKEVA